MHRPLVAALLLLAACKDIDPGGPVTGASLATAATEPGTTEPLTTGVTTGGTSTGAPDPGGTTTTGGVGDTGNPSGPTTMTSATQPSTDPTVPDPSAGPDPTETAFIVPMTDDGGDPSDPSSDPSNPSDPSGGSPYGQCGWSAQNNYYDCAPSGAPGVEDPNGQDPIACPAGLMANAPCSEQMGPVGNVGCCEPDGTLFYCTSQGSVLVQQECGA